MSNILTLPDSQQIALLDSVAQEFRQGFSDLTESAEEEFRGRNFVFSRYGKELYPCFEASDADLVPGCIIPLKKGRPVASVDSTCILIGETSTGALYAARTAVGISQEGALKRFVRMGPIFVYASPKGLLGIRSEASALETGLLLSDHSVAERVIRNTIERKVIESLLASEEPIIVMADGSLKHPFGQFSGSLPAAVQGSSSLVGFSKSSNLIFSEAAVGSLTGARGAAYHLLDDGPVKTVLAKFATDGLVFRLDLATGSDSLGELLGSLLWNDVFSAGYPESLKVAHSLSVFTKAEDHALRAFVTKRFGLKQLPTFALRTVTLGSFRGGA